jgi:methionine-rich copper-binding protein CopC
MVSPPAEVGNVKRDVFSGAMLIAGSLVFVLVMSLHPTAHEVLGAENATRYAHATLLIHAVALAGVPILFLGLLGLWRRLGAGNLATAALVLWAFASVAVTSAAVASGFVSTAAIQQIIELKEDGSGVYHQLLTFSGWINQGFATVHLVASSIAIVLWSVAILRSSRVQHAAGVAGLIAGASVLALFFAGHIRTDVHGFGVMVLVQSVWMVWVGVLLCRESVEITTAGRSGA